MRKQRENPTEGLPLFEQKKDEGQNPEEKVTKIQTESGEVTVTQTPTGTSWEGLHPNDDSNPWKEGKE